VKLAALVAAALLVAGCGGGAGCSAGSVGSAFHFDAVARRYPGARLAQLGDSLAFVFPRPIQLNDRGTHSVFRGSSSLPSRRAVPLASATPSRAIISPWPR
jgi:hypothetical protein